MKHLLVGLLLIHSSPGGMHYPLECCSNNDCGVIKYQERLSNGDLWVILENGASALFPKGFNVRTSTDGQGHACINPKTLRPLCLFLAPEV